MRAGLSLALVERLRRADPSAYVHVDLVAVDAEASKRTQAQWDGATGTGFSTLPTGGVALTGSLGALVENTTGATYLTDLYDDGTQFATAQIRWGGSESAEITLERLKLYLHPRRDGGQPQEVARWRVRVWAAYDARNDTVTGNPLVMLVPMGDYVDVTAGVAAGLVTFDFTGYVWKIRPKSVTPVPRLSEFSVPVTYVTIHALTATGAPAGNVGFAYDNGVADVTTSGNRIATRLLTRQSTGLYPGFYLDAGSAGGAPRMTVETASYTAATATFEDAGNRLDLGATPTGTVEFVARGELPPGTSLTFEVRNDADSAWVAFEDGDTTDDLAGVGKNQTYKVRVTLTPDTGGDVTPLARVLGVRELTTTPLKNLTTIEGPRWAVDPITLKGEIGEATLTVLRDGEQDFRDALTDLLATYDIGAVTVEVFVAAPALSRADWLHIDSFVIDELDYHSEAGIVVTLVTHLARLRQVIPRPVLIVTSGVNLSFAARTAGGTPATITRASGSFLTEGYQADDIVTVAGSTSNDGSYVVGSVEALVLNLARDENLVAEGSASGRTVSAWIRRPYEQTNQTLEDVWTDLADQQLALPGRMRGPGVEDDTTQVAQTIRDGDAKEELDAIAALAGGGNISSQGQVKFVSLVAESAVRQIFPAEEIEVLEMTAGLRHRVPESWIDYDWDEPERRFRAQVRGVNTAALTGLGEAYLEPARLDEAISRWIVSDALAQTMADRDVRYRATGVPQWRFRSSYSYPELEPGDLVAVETRQFVLRDPVAAAAVRGRLWALGMLVAVEGCDGRDFTIWIRQFADFLPATSTYDLEPGKPVVVEAYFSEVGDNPGQLAVRLAAPLGATIYYAVQDWGSALPEYGAAVFETYTAPFQITRLEALDRQLVVYATRSGLFSSLREFRIERDVDPTVTVTLSEPVGGTLRATWVPDDDVVFVRVYRKKNGSGNGWPTTNNNVDGPLDKDQLVRTIYVHEDGGAFDGTGAAVGPGGVQWEETGYVNTDVAKVIVVPFRTQEHVGERATASRTMTGSGGAALTAFTAAKTAAGSTCLAAAEITVSWTPNGTVADVTHDLKIYRRLNDGDWVLVKTETSPASVTSYVDEVEDYEDTGSGVWYHWLYSYELVAGATVLDSGVLGRPVKIESSGLCPLS